LIFDLQKFNLDRIYCSIIEFITKEYSITCTEFIGATEEDSHIDTYSCNGTILSRSTEIDQRRGVCSERRDFFVLMLVCYFSFRDEHERKLLVPPPFNIPSLKEYVMNSLTEAIENSSQHLRDPAGGTYANWLV
jgi:hypothetical protein